MGTKWKVPVLTQIILFEYINVKPRFYTREQVAQALAEILVWFVLLEGYAEQGFRSVKHRLSPMDNHFPWNSNAKTIERWFATYFLIYYILYCPVYLLDKGVIINVNISNE